jgi:hypothetical protein
MILMIGYDTKIVLVLQNIASVEVKISFARRYFLLTAISRISLSM